MAYEHLATYLNDHLAGSTTALELLEHLEAVYARTEKEQVFAELRADVTADRRELEALMERLNIAQSGPRKAAAWLAEKITEIKLRLDDAAEGVLHLLEAAEAVGLGIDGKRALWQALAVAAEESPGLQGVDYARLEQRAQEQRRRVERIRLEAAKAALGGSPVPQNLRTPDSLVPRPIDHPNPQPTPPGEDEPPQQEEPEE